MRVFVSILFSFFFFAAYAHAALPDWVGRPLPIEPELLKPPEIEGMVFVKGGCYKMGDSFGDGEADEKPVHTVCVDDFYMGKFEVTVGEFRRFVNDTGYRTEAEKNTGGVIGCFAFVQDDKEEIYSWQEWANWKKPNKYQDNEDNHPVTCVSWNDAQEYIIWKDRKEGQSYRFPTEAEWEYAARGWTQTRNYWGNDKDDVCKYANVADRTLLLNGDLWNNKHECSDGYAFVSPVGKFQPNAYGLYDMMGNVSEWIGDWYDADYYKNSPKNNPTGPLDGQYNMGRGGSWFNLPGFVRASFRGWIFPAYRDFSIGFRLAVSAR